jgi:hypothetical protein
MFEMHDTWATGVGDDDDDDDDKEEVEVEVWPTWTCEACTFTNDDVGEDTVNGQCVMCTFRKCFIAYVESTRKTVALALCVCVLCPSRALRLSRGLSLLHACMRCAVLRGVAQWVEWQVVTTRTLNQLLAHRNIHIYHAVTSAR